MITTVQQHYSPSMYSSLPPDQRPSFQPHRIQTSHLGNLQSGHHFAFQRMQPMSMPGPDPNHVQQNITSPSQVRQQQFPRPADKATISGSRRKASEARLDDNGNAPVRRRISRACDQCNQLRTKCDGRSPCAHCIEFGLACEYFRERKKRGKASRKDLAMQAAVAAAAAANPGNQSVVSPSYSSDDPSPTVSSNPHQDMSKSHQQIAPAARARSVTERSMSQSEHGSLMANHQSINQNNLDMIPGHGQNRPHPPSAAQMQQMPMMQDPQAARHGINDGSTPISLNGYGLLPDYNRAPVPVGSLAPGPMHNSQGLHPMQSHPNGYNSFGDHGYPVMSPQEHQAVPPNFPFLKAGESPLTSFMNGSPIAAGSPGWLSLPSPSGGYQQNLMIPPNTLRYPVLQPLMPHIASVLPISLACDLLELYFSSTTSAYVHPRNSFLLGFVFRKKSFLTQTRPRVCSPALLCSMLWVAAQVSDAPFLSSSPTARGRICQKLFEITIALLRPLIHGPTSADMAPNYGANTVINGLALGGLGVAAENSDVGNPGGASAGLDDVATYFHLATVVSASEFKAASLRWWNAAWSLARELKLNRELPPNPPPPPGRAGEDMDAEADLEVDVSGQSQSGSQAPMPDTPTEEQREERRRIWWLLYTVDRHLALCYNRPLFLTDVECEGLLHPVEDSIWQGGEVFNPDNAIQFRRRGPSFECTGPSIFGYFTPLMTILGEIVDLQQARNHPRFGVAWRGPGEWDEMASEITSQLDAYAHSLRDWEARSIATLHGHPQAQQPQQPNAMGGEVPNLEASHAEALQKPTPSATGASPSVRSVRTLQSHSSQQHMTPSLIHIRTVVAYGTHVLHVLHILLTGKWDPLTLLDDSDLWTSTPIFYAATQHAVAASDAITEVLDYDPDLTFMPFFFGMYLLQGSFLLLLIAEKLGCEEWGNDSQNDSEANGRPGESGHDGMRGVVGGLENCVRACEACVVTLNTEYQRNFRKVMRSALAQAKGRMTDDFGEQRNRRREVLSLYRWTGTGTGLAL